MNITVRNALIRAQHVPIAFHAIVVLQDLLVHNVNTIVVLVTVVSVILQQECVHIFVSLMSISKRNRAARDVLNAQMAVPVVRQLQNVLSV